MRFLKPYMQRAPLSGLSVTHGDAPVPTNRERLDALRSCLPPSLNNPYPWPYLQPKILPAGVVPLRTAGGRR
jgi:hypothetical protein